MKMEVKRLRPDIKVSTLTSIDTNTNTASVTQTGTDQALLKKRISRLLRKQKNKVCLDCSKANPRWITILSVSPPYTSQHTTSDIYLLGGFCCLECSGAHRRLGTHISFVRSMDLDSLKESDVNALECGGGNEKVNKIFEGSMVNPSIGEITTCNDSALAKKPKPDSSQKAREVFIRNKYEKKMYISLKEMSLFRQLMMSKKYLGAADDLISPASSTSTSSSFAASSPLKLQVFTSSPRTLAMIEKYMNPGKKKRNNFGRIIRNSLRRRGPRSSRKNKYVKKSLGGLIGIVGVNPNVNIVETRSFEFDDDDDECDSEKDEVSSVTSTRSSMSAFLRGGMLSCRSTSSQKRFQNYQHISKGNVHRSKPTTPASKKEKKRRSIFKKKNKKEKHDGGDTYAGSGSSGMNKAIEDELEVLKYAEVASPIPSTPKAKVPKSPRFRLTPFLRTPRRRNGHGAVVESSCASPSKAAARAIATTAPAMTENEEMKALKDWSVAIGKLMVKMSKKQQGGKKYDHLSTESTLLRPTGTM